MNVEVEMGILNRGIGRGLTEKSHLRKDLKEERESGLQISRRLFRKRDQPVQGKTCLLRLIF